MKIGLKNQLSQHKVEGKPKRNVKLATVESPVRG